MSGSDSLNPSNEIDPMSGQMQHNMYGTSNKSYEEQKFLGEENAPEIYPGMENQNDPGYMPEPVNPGMTAGRGYAPRQQYPTGGRFSGMQSRPAARPPKEGTTIVNVDKLKPEEGRNKLIKLSYRKTTGLAIAANSKARSKRVYSSSNTGNESSFSRDDNARSSWCWSDT